MEIHVISGEDGAMPYRHAPRPTRPLSWQGYLLAILAVAACTVAGKLLTSFDLSITVMVFLLGVILVALRAAGDRPSWRRFSVPLP